MNYWSEFEQTKLLSTKISFRPSFCIDTQNLYPGNTAYCIRTGSYPNYLAVLLNSQISEYYCRKVFLGKLGGFYEVQPDGLEAFPVPKPTSAELRLINEINYASIAQQNPRLEQLLNGFVYELFFKEDMHAHNLTLFAEAEKAGLSALSGLEGTALIQAAEQFAATHLVPGARLRTMLSDIATLDVVRIIEGRE